MNNKKQNIPLPAWPNQIFVALVCTLMPVVAGATTDTQHQVSGYIQLDTIFNIEDDSNNEHALVRLVSDEARDEEGDINLTSLHSRLNITTLASNPEMGQIKSVIEGDFFGGGVMGLRHAYFTHNNMLFGQTWTTFMDLAALPEKGEFGGSAARVFSRKSMVRFSHEFASGKLELALEQPLYNLAGEQDAVMPDVIARFTRKTGFGHVAAAALLQNVVVEDSANNVDDSAIALAGRVSGRVNLEQNDNVKFAVIFGQGLGGYLNFTDTASANITNNKIELSDTMATRVSYQHHWSNQLRSTLVIAKTTADINGVDAGDYQSLHVNCIYSPFKPLKYGLELINASKEQTQGADLKLNRFQLFAQYKF